MQSISCLPIDHIDSHRSVDACCSDAVVDSIVGLDDDAANGSQERAEAERDTRVVGWTRGQPSLINYEQYS